jgi:hypothetical protein
MTSLLSPRRLAAVALAASALSGFGSSASAGSPACDRAGARPIHTAHETVGSAGAGTPAQAVTSPVSEALHTPVETTYCSVPLLP